MSTHTVAAAGLALSIGLAGASTHAWPGHRSDSGQAPALFQAEIEELANARVASIEVQVGLHELPSEALATAHANLVGLERQLRNAASDGVITTREDREIRRYVQRIGSATGGGPYYNEGWPYYRRHY